MRARSSARCAPSRFASRCSRSSPGARKARLQTGNCEPKRAHRTPFPGPGNMAGSEPNVREAAAKEKSSQRVESRPCDRSSSLRNRASASGDRRRRPGPHIRLDKLDRATGPRGNELLGCGLASGTGLHACAVQEPAHESIPIYGSDPRAPEETAKLESLRLCGRQSHEVRRPFGRRSGVERNPR